MKYDVFVSFKVQDIHYRVLDRLVEAFKRNQINALVDDGLEKGEDIWPSVVGAIEASSISFIIFSPDYASSRWCLEELVTILECRKKYGQIVIPIFYKVEPRDVQYQSSQSYKDAFEKHEISQDQTKVQQWRCALNRSAEFFGIESSTFQNDAELIKEMANLVLMWLVNRRNPMSGIKALQIKYDVFVSFKGEICRKFLSHLVDSFKIENINAFIDDKLGRRDKLWIKPIEASSISLIIFSSNYASSSWCLEELVTILECKEKYGRIVVPIFYNVEPSDVRHQSSHKYKNAFAKHERKNISKVQIWRDALKKSAELSGIESSKFQ